MEQRNRYIAIDGYVPPGLNENPGLLLPVDGGGRVRGLSPKHDFEAVRDKTRLLSWVFLPDQPQLKYKWYQGRKIC